MARFNLDELIRRTTKNGDCLIWNNAKSKAGYGQVWDTGKVRYVHRLVAELVYGEAPANTDVMHSCDVRACCNPQHLSYGTRLENMQDASKKGRLIGRPHIKGENHPSAKLTDAEVAELRQKRLNGMKLQELAAEFGISVAAVSQMARGKVRADA